MKQVRSAYLYVYPGVHYVYVALIVLEDPFLRGRSLPRGVPKRNNNRRGSAVPDTSEHKKLTRSRSFELMIHCYLCCIGAVRGTLCLALEDRYLIPSSSFIHLLLVRFLYIERNSIRPGRSPFTFSYFIS